MRAGRVFRRLVIARIEDQVAGLAGKVFDQALASTAHPYATLGASDWSNQADECGPARLQSLQIDIWHSGASKGELEDLTDDVAAALDGFADEDRLTMHPIEVTLIRVIDDPSGNLHGIVQLEVDLEG